MKSSVKSIRTTPGFFESCSNKIAHFTGSSLAFTIACLTILAWAFTGPVFNYSATWQLIINTGTTIITFLMVFLIQKAQNKDSKAIHLKLNELIASIEGSSNRVVDAEDLTEEELNELQQYYVKLAHLRKRKSDLLKAQSIDAMIEEKKNEEEEEEKAIANKKSL